MTLSPAAENAPSDRAQRVICRWLYLICGLTDFAVFLVIFTASRTLADRHAEPWYLGLIGGGLSFTAGIGSLAGGWLASQWNGRAVFAGGALGIVGTILICMLFDPATPSFLIGYWSLGVSLGFVYPPLIGWLNQGNAPHANQVHLSRRLIVYCISWNAGMMIGQLTGGELFEIGPQWTHFAALGAASINVLVVFQVVRLVGRLPAVSVEGESAASPSLHQVQASLFKRLSWIANLGGVFGGGIVMHLLPDLAVGLGIPAGAHGRLLAGWRAVIIGAYLIMHLSRFWQYRFAVSLGSQGLGALGLLLIASANSPLQLFAGLALLGQLVGFNYFSGLYYSTAGSSQKTRALAAGIHEATLAAGMALGTLISGLLGSWIGSRLPYQLAGGVVVVLMAVQIAARQRWTRQAPVLSDSASR